MQRSKEKRKNDEAQNPVAQWVHAYISWLRADFRTYRLIYFLPMALLIIVPISPLLLHNVRVDYFYGEHIVFQVAVLMGLFTHFILYLATTFISLIILILKARAFLSLLIITIPVGFMIWGMGFILCFTTGIFHELNSLSIGDYLYRVAWVEPYFDDDDDIADFIIFRCDSIGVQCNPIADGAVYAFGSPPQVELEVRGTQLHLYDNDPRDWRIEEDRVLVTSVDLD